MQLAAGRGLQPGRRAGRRSRVPLAINESFPVEHGRGMSVSFMFLPFILVRLGTH